MSKTKTEKYKTNIFAISLPRDWKVEIKDYLYSLYNPDGFGVIQISTYAKRGGNTNTSTILESEIKKIMSRRNIKNIKIKYIQKNGYTGAIISFIQAHRFWKILIACSKDAIAFITYNCKEEDKQVEVRLVESIINTFQFVNGK